MEILIAILGILAGAIGCYILNRKRKGELEALSKEKDDLFAKLTKAEQDKVDSETQLNDARREISGLTKQVNVASKQVEGLTIQLSEVSESNENALKLLYLFEVSLQLSVFVIYSEVSRVAYLAEAYKELYKEYKEFLEEVDKRTKRRLVRTGIGTVMSLIPGVGILQLGADIAELADFAETVVDGTAELDDVMQAVNSSLNILNSLGEFINLSEIGVLQSEISSDEDREKVMQEYQSVFEEVFRQDQGWGTKEPNASDFDNFLKTLIQRMKMFVDSMPERERRKALDRIVGNFGRFGIRFHKIRTDSSLPTAKD